MGILAFIGLGLYGIRDLSLGALNFLKRAKRVFLEYYTSVIPNFDVNRLANFLRKSIEVMSREDIEERGGDIILEAAEKAEVAFLTPGNPFIATTHINLRLEAEKKGIRTLIYPAPSVIDGIISATGLHSYKLGRSVTIVYPEEDKGYWPLTPYDVLKGNLSLGLHTLFLLDVKRCENRYMTVREGIQILLDTEKRVGGDILEKAVIVGIARATAPNQRIVAGNICEVMEKEIGPPPHSIVIPGPLHPSELEALKVLAGAKEEVLREWDMRVKKELKYT